ncbi:DUF4399 domain-containing protein [Aurantivibrio infirmus]
MGLFTRSRGYHRNNHVKLFSIITLIFSCSIFAQEIARTPAPEGARVYFISPQDGATVGREVVVIFGLEGMGVAPAGIDKENTGHHHLLVDQAELPNLDQPLGNPPLHFGGGQTQTTLNLEPGTHTLQLILGDKFHIPHQPPVLSEKITITVK